MRYFRSRMSMLIVIPVLLVSGCEQRYRYPCQNPANWHTAECQRPQCEVNRDCPDLIFKDNSNIKPPAAATLPTTPRGDCK